MILDAMSITLGIVLASLFAAYSIFAYRYARFSPWNATWQGITLEAQKITLAILVLFFFIDTFIDGYWPGRYSILLILMILLAVEAWATLIGLLDVQKRKGRTSKVRVPERDITDAESPLPDVDRLQ